MSLPYGIQTRLNDGTFQTYDDIVFVCRAGGRTPRTPRLGGASRCSGASCYEGHPINKLLNGIFLSIFRIWKIRDIRFVDNLFMNTSCEFHQDDVIMVTSPAFWTQSFSAVFYPAAVFLHNSPALNSIAHYEKNEQVHQADLFKRHTLMFIFQHEFYIHLSIYPIYQVNTREWTAAIVASLVARQNNTAARSFLFNNTFSTLSKFFTWNIVLPVK